jgi:alanyl aminopeptidase
LPDRAAPPSGGAESIDAPPWLVPVCVAYEQAGGRAQACTMLTEATGTLELASCPRWLAPNADGHGYYRTSYSAAQLIALRDVAWPQLTWNERLAMFFDAVDEVNVGKLPLALPLSLVPELLAGGDRFTVGRAVELAESFDAVIPDDLRGKYEYWLRTTFGPGAQRIGLLPKDSDDLDTEAMRSSLIHVVGTLGREPKLIADTLAAAEHWRELPQAVRGNILITAVDNRPALFERILREVASEPDRARRTEMYRALGRVHDPAQQRTVLQLVLEPKLDIRETLGLLFEAPTDANRAIAQQFFRDHAEALLQRMPGDETASPIAGISRLFTESCDAARRDEVVDYVTRTFAKLPGGERVVKQAIEEMDQCIAKKRVLEPELRGWLMGIRLPKPKK